MDQFERMVLAAFDLDGGASIAGVSRQSGYTRDRIRDALLRWTNAGVIGGFTTVIDIGKLGYTGVAVYARISGANERQRSKVVQYLVAHPRIYWVAEMWGPFDLLFALQVRNMVELAEILGDIQRRQRSIVETELAVRVRVTQFARTYLDTRKAVRKQVIFTGADHVSLPAVGPRKLLAKLLEDPRSSVKDLSDSGGTSRPTVYSYIQQLEQSGIVSGVSCQIESVQLGYTPYHLLVRVRRADQQITARVREFVRSQPHMIFCIETVGRWQYELGCEVEESTRLQKTIGLLRDTLRDVLVEVELVPFSRYYTKYRFSL